MKRVLLFWILSIICISLTAQTDISIKGNVKDENSKPVAAATISLLNAGDSSLVKAAISDVLGDYRFEKIKNGKFLVLVTGVNYGNWYSPVFDYNGIETYSVPVARLLPVEKKLKDVTVVARKPMIEVRADRTIFNVENSINATGSNAMELLQKSPGVLVDKDDNISMKGKNGVRIYIDGRLSPMSAGDLAAYLRSIQSNDIEAIEMIENPSAKYDASGNAGIINIKLKKNKKFGTNGNVNAGYNQGIYGKYNTGVSLNYRNKKINLYSNLSGNYGNNESFMNFSRHQNDSIYDARNVFFNKSKSLGVKAGADYFINSRNTLGVMYTGNYSNNERLTTTNTYIAPQTTKITSQVLQALNDMPSSRDNTNFNINYRYADTSGRELNIDADRGIFTGRGESFQPNYYIDARNGNLLRANIYTNITPTDIDIYTAKADYEQDFKKGKLGIGAKYSKVKTNNIFDFFNIKNNIPVKDIERSNNFTYTENVNAGYVNYNRQFKEFSVQFGVRAEQTNSEGILQSQSRFSLQDTFEIVKRNYLDFFPSAAFSFSTNPNHQFNINYSRRIDRPRYEDLNPFEFKLDELTFRKGNAFLRPQYTNSFAASHTYKSILTSSLSYSHIKDYFTTINDTTRKNASFITQKNLAAQDIYSVNFSAPLQIKKWWNAYISLNTNHSRYKADFDDGKIIRLNVTTVNYYNQHTFTLGKGYTAELSGWFNTPSVWGGTFRTKFMWSTDAGIQKTIWDKKGTIKLSFTDIFQTARWRSTSNFAGTQFDGNGGWESRQVRLNFSYRFGSSQVKAARNRKTSIESESNRLAP
jgi:iron complex outermembrane recepter protein